MDAVGAPENPDDVRVGHAEREAATAALGGHLVAGRLLPTEYEQRAEAVTAARTRADLRAALRELPDAFAAWGSGSGMGRFPEGLRADLAAEGLVALVEGLAGTITYRRYRAGGVRVRRKEVAVVGALAVSRVRLVVWIAGSKHVDVPFAHPLWPTLEVAAEPTGLRVTYRAGVFHPDRSGRVDLRLATPAGRDLAGLLGGGR